MYIDPVCHTGRPSDQRIPQELSLIHIQMCIRDRPLVSRLFFLAMGSAPFHYGVQQSENYRSDQKSRLTRQNSHTEGTAQDAPYQGGQPAGNIYELTDDETEYLRTNLSTANISSKSRYNPHVFTEQGLYMLMTVLKGPLAIKQSKACLLYTSNVYKRQAFRQGEPHSLYEGAGHQVGSHV